MIVNRPVSAAAAAHRAAGWRGLHVFREITNYVKKSSESSYFYEWQSSVCIIIRSKFH